MRAKNLLKINMYEEISASVFVSTDFLMLHQFSFELKLALSTRKV